MAAKADEHRATVMPGRTHAQPAVPVTFGGKLAVWLAELTRHRQRLRAARERAVVVQLFGAAGTAAALGPQSRAVRHALAERLGLGTVDVPWHTARDGVAETGFVLAAAAGTCGKLAREVVELSRPEIGEVREEGGHLRGASSTMPQKANPIGSEAVVGLSILAAHHAGALLTAMQGTHERAAGEWQAEWDALPLTCAAAAGALAGARRVVAGLSVFPDRMRANLDGEGGSIMAEAAMMAVADVVGRADAHAIVSEASSAARGEGLSLRIALERGLDARCPRRHAPARRSARPGFVPGRDRRDRHRRDRRLGARRVRERLAAGRLEQLDGDAVRVSQIERESAPVDPCVDLDGSGDERRHALRHQVLVERAKIRDDEAEVGGADVARLDVGLAAGRREVLEQLDHVLAAGEPEMGHSDVGVGVADDGGEVAAFLLLRCDHLAAEEIAIEDERAVEIGDRVAGVVDVADGHGPLAIASRNSTPPAGVTTKMFSTRAPKRPGK